MKSFLKNFKVIIWDFDGVIKESVEIKSIAYQTLFFAGGKKLLKKIKDHHELNGGMSRYKKIPLYLRWAGFSKEPRLTQKFCKKFADICQKKVINSKYVPGVYAYLKENHKIQKFFMVSATPTNEMKDIAKKLKIKKFFKKIFGSPCSKKLAIQKITRAVNFDSKKILMIGDSKSDFLAARESKIKFLLRKTKNNKKWQNKYKGPFCKNFKNE